MTMFFKKPAVGLRQRLTFDDFHIIEQVGEGTYGCVPCSSSSSLSFYLCIWFLCSSTFFECSCKFNSGLRTMYIRHRVAQLSNKPTLRIAQPIIRQLYVAPCLLPLGLTPISCSVLPYRRVFKARNKHTNKLTALKVVFPTEDDEGVNTPRIASPFAPSASAHPFSSLFAQLPFTAVREIKYLQMLHDNPNVIKLEGTFFTKGTPPVSSARRVALEAHKSVLQTASLCWLSSTWKTICRGCSR